MNNLTGIYIMKWKKAGLFYIGSTLDFKRRINNHCSELKIGTHPNKKAIDAYIQHGLPEFILIEPCSEGDLANKEFTYLSMYINDDKCINKSVNTSPRLNRTKIDATRNSLLEKPYPLPVNSSLYLLFNSESVRNRLGLPDNVRGRRLLYRHILMIEESDIEGSGVFKGTALVDIKRIRNEVNLRVNSKHLTLSS